MKVVIIGGGYAGTALAKELDPDFDVTLIEKRERFFHNSGSLRAAVDAGWLRKLFIPYDALLKRGGILNAKVVDVKPDEVVLEDGQHLKFDALVLATGSSYPFPAKMASDRVTEAEAAVRLVNERIAQAKSILLIGAGPVGIELAGEIAELYPGKTVTLIDPGERLLPAFHPKLGERLYAGLRKMGVQVLLGERLVKMPTETNATQAVQPSMQTTLTEKGTRIEADLHFLCFGMQMNTAYLQPHFGDLLDERKQVRVNSHLQVQGYKNIFAMGDIVNTGEPKLITTADAHASLVAENLRRLAANRPDMLEYRPRPVATVVVPLGTSGGAAQLPLGKNGIVLGAWAASLIKGKTLRAPQRWQALGAKLEEKN